jgi:16S rRNA (adenine1518-N6/adenine1519-N6)-dimethyltransferase
MAIGFPYYSRDRIQSDLRRYGGAIRKSKGQNFLIDPSTIDRLVRPVLDAVLSSSSPSLIEIGPGLGALTHRLIEHVPVTALELDPLLAKLLRQQFEGQENFTLIEGDARRTLAGLTAPVLCGNLPYYITTELILESLSVPGVQHLFFLVQTEFARRACARTAESSFTVYLRNFGEGKLLERVPATCFFPVPSVESSFITIARYEERAPAAILEKLLRMSYRGKRKKIRNSWRAGEALLPVELLEDLGPAAGVDCEKRAEEIDIEAYHSLARLIAASDFR